MCCQTTAHFDVKSQEFVLNTPTLRSMKWWPGGLGKTACFCMLYAQLIIDEKELGFHCFIIQLRDENHQPMKGVEVFPHPLFFLANDSFRSHVSFLFSNGKVGEVGPKVFSHLCHRHLHHTVPPFFSGQCSISLNSPILRLGTMGPRRDSSGYSMSVFRGQCFASWPTGPGFMILALFVNLPFTVLKPVLT